MTYKVVVVVIDDDYGDTHSQLNSANDGEGVSDWVELDAEFDYFEEADKMKRNLRNMEQIVVGMP